MIISKYELLTDEQYEYKDCSWFIVRDGIFEVQEFLDGLEGLYHNICFYNALQELKCGDDSFSQHLYYEGKFSDGYSFLERHKGGSTPQCIRKPLRRHISGAEVG